MQLLLWHVCIACSLHNRRPPTLQQTCNYTGLWMYNNAKWKADWILMGKEAFVIYSNLVQRNIYIKKKHEKNRSFNITVLWDVTPCVLLEWGQYSRDTCSFLFFNLRHYKADGYHFYSGKYVNRPLLTYCTSFFLRTAVSLLFNIDSRQQVTRPSRFPRKARVRDRKCSVCEAWDHILCNKIQLLRNCLNIWTVIVWRWRNRGRRYRYYGKAIPGQTPRGSRTSRIPDFQSSGHMKLVRLSALYTGRLYPLRKYSW
jgi:hypothetical protein